MTIIFINDYHTIAASKTSGRSDHTPSYAGGASARIAGLGETLSGRPHFVGGRAALRT